MNDQHNALRQVTLCFLLRPQEILLPMKKEGFGAGKPNGVGGKVRPGETVEDTIRREAWEEVRVRLKDLTHVATLDFFFPDVPASERWDQRVFVFLCRDWGGEPQETEEMTPAWFPTDAIPYDAMWVPDRHWLPKILAGAKIRGRIRFAGHGERLTSIELTEGTCEPWPS